MNTDGTNIAEQSDKPGYAERVVGFVDILGFRELVQSALREQVVDALGKVRSTASPTSSDTDLRAQNFSDSLILSAKNTADGMWHLLLSVNALALGLLEIGVLIRGAVTVGRVLHDEHMVFGPGVNEAYRLESTVAKFPRIILGRHAFSAVCGFAKTEELWEAITSARLLRDSDGVWFLNYLNNVAAANITSRGSSRPGEDKLFDQGTQIQSVIQGKLDTSLDAPDVYAKLRWLGEYWNRVVVGSDDANVSFKFVRLAGNERPSIPLPFSPSF